MAAVPSFGADFDVAPGYLNTPAVGAPPRPVVEAVRAHTDAWGGAELEAARLDDPVEVARAAFAALVGVPSARVAIGPTVAGLVGIVASSLPPGRRVLTADREFTSVTFPFAAAGHEVVEVPVGQLPARAAGCDVVAVSAVASADGAVVDLPALRAAVAGTDTLVLLDGTQALGWLPADLSWADGVVAGGYKWLLCPRGASWMAVSPRLLERLTPIGANWYAGRDRWSAVYGMPLRLAEDARRLDTSPVWHAHVGAAVALPWLLTLDRERVRAHDVGLANRVRAGLDMGPASSPIVSIRRERADERLARAGLRCASRDGAARIGFHLHNTESDTERVLEALAG